MIAETFFIIAFIFIYLCYNPNNSTKVTTQKKSVNIRDLLRDEQNKNKILNDEVTKLNNTITELQQMLNDILPNDHQCCVCFNYTKKDMTLNPCGHSQYCESCIYQINKCSVCNVDIVSRIKIY